MKLVADILIRHYEDGRMVWVIHRVLPSSMSFSGKGLWYQYPVANDLNKVEQIIRLMFASSNMFGEEYDLNTAVIKDIESKKFKEGHSKKAFLKIWAKMFI